jgi:hypothetical protein
LDTKLGDSRVGLDDFEKRTFLTLPGLDSDSSVVQLIASRLPTMSDSIIVICSYDL